MPIADVLQQYLQYLRYILHLSLEMGTLPFPTWAEQPTLFKLPCADPEPCPPVPNVVSCSNYLCLL